MYFSVNFVWNKLSSGKIVSIKDCWLKKSFWQDFRIALIPLRPNLNLQNFEIFLTLKRPRVFRRNLLNLHFISKKAIFHFFWFSQVWINFLEKNDFYHLNPFFGKWYPYRGGEYGGGRPLKYRWNEGKFMKNQYKFTIDNSFFQIEKKT